MLILPCEGGAWNCRQQAFVNWAASKDKAIRRVAACETQTQVAADLGLIARACASEEGDAHAGSLLKAIELLRFADGNLTVGDYVDVLARLVGRDEKHDGIPARPPTGLPVRVMNLHQCKGLEAPFVFLVDPSGEVDHDVEVLLIGVGFIRCTTLHHAEYSVEATSFESPLVPVPVESPNGDKTVDWRPVREICFIDDATITALGESFEANNRVAVGHVANAESRLLSQRQAVDYAITWLEQAYRDGTATNNC